MLIPMTAKIAETTDLDERIRHAESYPFSRPACSYLFEGGVMRSLRKGAIENRRPVIAAGSNASPARLVAKFGDSGEIPVMRAELRHFAVVFAGHFTAYGAIPATLCPHPGATTDVWITWLTESQLEVMHRSEGVVGTREAEQRYDYAALEGLDLQLETGRMINQAGAYLSRRMLAPNGSPIRFAEVRSDGCALSAASQPAALRKATNLLDPEASFPAFMAEVLSGVDRRQALFQNLTPYTIERDDAWPDGSPAIPSIDG